MSNFAVDLIREYYGFEEEDLGEIARIKETITAQARGYSIMFSG